MVRCGRFLTSIYGQSSVVEQVSDKKPREIDSETWRRTVIRTQDVKDWERTASEPLLIGTGSAWLRARTPGSSDTRVWADVKPKWFSINESIIGGSRSERLQ